MVLVAATLAKSGRVYRRVLTLSRVLLRCWALVPHTVTPFLALPSSPLITLATPST